MFRGATRSDLPEILKIYARAREAMAAAGNPAQWGASFPPEELLKEDIDSNRLFVYLVNGELEAVFAFILGPDPTYAVIEDGQWLNDTLPYGTIHRPAGLGGPSQRRDGRGHYMVSRALREPARRHPRRQQSHAAHSGRNRFYPLRRHPCGRRLPSLCLPADVPYHAAGTLRRF